MRNRAKTVLGRLPGSSLALDNNVNIGSWKAAINGKEIGSGMQTTGWANSVRRIVLFSLGTLGGSHPVRLDL